MNKQPLTQRANSIRVAPSSSDKAVSFTKEKGVVGSFTLIKFLELHTVTIWGLVINHGDGGGGGGDATQWENRGSKTFCVPPVWTG